MKVTFKNRTVQKFISCLIIFAMFAPVLFLSFQPKQAGAVNPVGVPVNDFTIQAMGWKALAKEVARQFLIITAKKLLAKMTQSTVNWINSGFHGNPLYLENPKSFFKDIAKFEVRNLVNQFGYNSLKYPFGKYFVLDIIDSYQRQLADNAQYSLSKVIYDPDLLERYRNDFNVGGWNGFLINTQYPQNNYLGFRMLATEELARRLDGTVTNAAKEVQDTLQKGMGFLSPQTCPSNLKYNNLKNQFNQPGFTPPKYSPPSSIFINPNLNDAKFEGPLEETRESAAMRAAYQKTYNEKYTKEYAAWAEKNDCPEGLVSTTPGWVVANQITGALGSTRTEKELAAALGNSITAILDNLMSHFMNKGLNALTNRTPPPDDGTTRDNFTYFGDTISGALNKSDIYGSYTYTPPGGPSGDTGGGSSGSGNGDTGGGNGDNTGAPPSSLLSAVQTERDKYPPFISASDVGKILNTVAWNNRAAGWGLSHKDFGTFCSSPVGPISCDILIHKPTNTWVDVFTASDSTAGPTWDVIIPNDDPRRVWVAPVQP